MRVDGDPKSGKPVVVLAHGAGADSSSDFMAQTASSLSQRGLTVVRFDFPYMIRRRETGRRSPPDREPKLLAAFADVVRLWQNDHPVVVGGKSMGGRMASRLAAFQEDLNVCVSGWFALGYPFHPPGRPERLRVDHFDAINVPGCIVQGTRDPFGRREEHPEQWLSRSIDLCWLEDGNHDLQVRQSSGLDRQMLWSRVMDQLAASIWRWVR